MSDEKILVIEDDPDISALIRLYLEHHDYKVYTASTGKTGIQTFTDIEPDLVVLDVALPDMNGIEICRRLRTSSSTPVIFVSCHGDSTDIVAGLETGGDDYVVKPFDPVVLMARVQANLRRRVVIRSAENPELVTCGRLKLNLQSYEVFLDDTEVPLYAKERQLLFFLASHIGQVFSVRQLFERVWGLDSDSDERTVMVHISNLRRKIERAPSNPEFIITVRGFGYRFYQA